MKYRKETTLKCKGIYLRWCLAIIFDWIDLIGLI